MSVSHVKSVTVADFTGTVTVFNSAGNTVTANATDIVRPSDWNSVHNQFFTLTGNTNNNSTASGANVVLSGGNGVTLIGSNSVIGFSVATSYLTSQSNQAFSASGGSSAFQTLNFNNANGATFSNNGGSVELSYTVPTQSNQSLGIYGSSQTYGQSSSSTHDARSLTIVGSGGVSVGWSNSSFLISGQTTAAQTNQSAIKGLGVSNTGNTAGNTGISTGIDWVIAGSNNITASQSTVGGGPNTIWISGPTVGGAQTGISGIVVSDTTYTSGTVSFSNQANITIGSSVNGATQYIRLSGNAAQTNQSAIRALGVSNTGNTAGNTGVSTGIDWVIAGSNGITASQSTAGGGPNTIWLSGVTTAAQTNQTIGFYGSSQTTGSASSGTLDARSVSIIGAGIISVGMHSTSAGGTTTGLLISATQSNQAVSNSAGSFTFQTLNFSNANNVTWGTSAGGIVTASVAAPGAAAENNWVNLLGANTAGNTTASGSTLGWSGINLTLSGTNDSQIKISAPPTSSLVGWRGLEASTNGSTISMGQTMGSYFRNVDNWGGSGTIAQFQSTSHVVPFQIDDPMSISFIRIPMTMSMSPSSTAATTGNSQFSYGHSRSHNFVIYSRGIGASSLSLQSVTSTQLTDQQSINVSAAANSTQFSYTNRATYQSEGGTFSTNMDYSSSAASLNFHTSGMTAFSGNKMMAFPFAISLNPGQYWLAYGVSSSTTSQFNAQGSRLFNVASNFCASNVNIAFGTLGGATNSSVGPYYGLGSFTTAGGGTTNSIPISAISTSASHLQLVFELARIA